MKPLGPVRRLFRLGLRRPDPSDEVDWEIAHYLSEMSDRLVEEEGLSPQEAELEARRRFGSVEEYRRGLKRIERRRKRMTKMGNVRIALAEVVSSSLRSLARQPGFSLVVIVTLAVGIGANASMFTILDRLLFRAPDHVVHHTEVRRVVVARSFLGRLAFGGAGTYPDVVDLRAHGGLESVAAYAARDWTSGSGAEAEKVRVTIAEHTLFPLLGVSASRGRFYDADDDGPGAEPVAVLSHEFWQRWGGGDVDVLGTTLRLEGVAFTIVGIAPKGFTGAEVAPVDVWVPLYTGGAVSWGRLDWGDSRGRYWLSAVARLNPGVSPEAASEEATALHRAGRQEQLDAGRYDPDVRILFDPLIRARGPQAGAESRVARWLGGVSLLLLVIACANVANMLLARGTKRRREVAVRLALGVSRRRLVGRTLLETAILGLCGSMLGLVAAAWGGGVLRTVLIPDVHFPSGLGVRVIAFSVGLALVAGALAGIAPALQAARLDLAHDLSSGGRGASGSSKVRSLLSAGQAALSVVLLVGAGLFIKSVGAVRSLDLGLDVDRLAMASLDFESGNPLESEVEAALDTEVRNRVYADAVQRLEAATGFTVAATNSPFGWGFAGALEVPGWDSIPNLPGGGPYYNDVAQGYFETVGLRLLEGRVFDGSESEGSDRVAVVSETMARTLWPEEGALGGCLLIPEGDNSEVSDVCTTVVGVVEDASRGQLEQDAHMTYYLPLVQRPASRINGLYIRTPDPAAALAPVAAVLRDLGPSVRFAEIRTLREALDPQARSWTLGATLFSLFGLLALLIAGIGLYGVLAFHVAQRTRELGIRAALGAAKGRILKGVLQDGAKVTLVGVVAGGVLVLALGPLVDHLLFQVSVRDPLVLMGAGAVLLAVGVLASLMPGLRATQVDPMEALRTE